MIRWVAYRRADGQGVLEARDVWQVGDIVAARIAEGCIGVKVGSTAEKATARSDDALAVCCLCQRGSGAFEHADCPAAIAKLERQLRRAVAARGAA